MAITPATSLIGQAQNVGATTNPDGTMNATAAGYNPAQVSDPTKWNVDANQTVAGQLTSVMDPNSPLIQQARARADARMNDRGMLNSSMATSAADSAAYDAAIPIATSDAATYGKAAGYNADAANNFTLTNNAAQNTAAGFNANAQNKAVSDQLSANTQKFISTQSAETQKAVASMNTTSQQLISAAHDANSFLLQNSTAAQQAYNTYANTVANIDALTTMDVNGKQAAIDSATQIYNNQINGIKQASPGAAASTVTMQSPQAPASSVQPTAVVPGQAVAPAAQAVGGVDVSSMLNFPGNDR